MTTSSATSARNKTQMMILCALFAALTAVCTMISIPLPFTPVPVNLATLSVYMAGGLLGARYGAISQLIYVLLGAVGLPVFSNFTGGLGKLAGPTGGYILGYVAGALVIGLLLGLIDGRGVLRNENAGRNSLRLIRYPILALFMVAGCIVCYSLGTIWYMFVTNTGALAALTLCVFPFIPGDLMKIIAATLLCGKLRRHLRI